MPRPQLRIYLGPEQSPSSVAGREESERGQRISLPLQEIFPILADAVRNGRTWLHDFAEDEIAISADLYEVLLAYQHHCQRPTA